MEDELLDFLEWLPNNMEHIFEIMDKPKELVKEYLKQKQQAK